MYTLRMKICSKCKIEKETSEFYKNKNSKDGLYSYCKQCHNAITKQYNKSGKGKEAVMRAIAKYQQSDKGKDAVKRAITKFQQSEKGKDLVKKAITKYQQSDKGKDAVKRALLKYSKTTLKQRIAENPVLQLARNVRLLISVSLKKNNFTKRSRTYQILGCSFEEFKTHIETQFQDGMSWKNRKEWHLDHIVPISLATTEEEVLKFNHYTNFRPLWGVENIKKSNRLDHLDDPEFADLLETLLNRSLDD